MRYLWRRQQIDEIVFWVTALIAALLVSLDVTRIVIR